MKNLYYFQNGGYPYAPYAPQQQQYWGSPYNLDGSTAINSGQAFNPNLQFNPSLLNAPPQFSQTPQTQFGLPSERPQSMFGLRQPSQQQYAPGTADPNDINNDGVPDYILSPNNSFAKNNPAQNKTNQQQYPYNPYMYGFGFPGSQTFNQKLGSAIAFQPQQFENQPFSLRGQRALRGLQIGASAIGSALTNTREIFGSFAQSKRNQYLMQRDSENRRNGLLGYPDGQEMLFNNGWMQRGVLGFIEDGGMFKDGGKYNPNSKRKMYENGGEQKNNVPFEKLLTDGVTGVRQDKYNEGKQTRQVNAEVEKNEYIIYPDGKVVKVLGKKHNKKDLDNSGERVNLPEGAKIVSDNILVSKEHAKMFKDFGIKTSTKNTYAEALDKFRNKIGIVDLNEQQEGRFEDLKDNQDVQDENTKKVNEEFLSKHIHDLEKKKQELSPLEKFFGDLVYKSQEAVKKSPNVKKENDSDIYEEGGEYDLDEKTIKQLEREGYELERK